MKKDIKNIAPFRNDYQSVCGIDALYFYIKVDFSDYSNFYINHLLEGVLINDNFKLISHDYSKQFTYLQYSVCEECNDEQIYTKFCRIGFKNLNLRDGLDFIVVQMESTMLQRLSINEIKKELTSLLNSFNLVPLKFQLSRVDLNTYIFDFSFDWLTYDFFSTKLKVNKSYNNGSKLETITFGSRTNHLIFRIYNKKKELLTRDYEIAVLKEYLINLKYLKKYKTAPVYEDLWNIEVELKREQLKLYNIDTLDDLTSKINNLHSYLFNNVLRLLVRQKDVTKNDNRLFTHTVWEHIISNYNYSEESTVEVEKNKLKIYKHDIQWLTNRLQEFLDEPFNVNNNYYDDVHKLFTNISKNTQNV
jgi:hypothetical protein